MTAPIAPQDDALVAWAKTKKGAYPAGSAEWHNKVQQMADRIATLTAERVALRRDYAELAQDNVPRAMLLAAESQLATLTAERDRAWTQGYDAKARAVTDAGYPWKPRAEAAEATAATLTAELATAEAERGFHWERANKMLTKKREAEATAAAYKVALMEILDARPAPTAIGVAHLQTLARAAIEAGKK